MKRHLISTIIAAMAGLMAFSSCSKWLEATSTSQISEDKLFSSRSGFHEALIGVYLDLGSSSCYGKDYTWFVNELTAMNYTTDNSATMKALQSHLYTSTAGEPIFKDMWAAGYNVIANANKVLLELDKHRDIITSDVEYNLIKGELLAIRAYVHFDLLRMYGLGRWDGENASKMTVPYVTTYSKEVTPQKSYSETAELLKKDVMEALECLSQDPITGNAPVNFNSALNADSFWSFRERHLNYYAVEALAARIAMWENDFDKAFSYASDVVDKAFDAGLVSWVDANAMIKAVNNDQRDWSFSSEHLFSLEVTDLYSTVRTYMYDSDANMLLSSTSILGALFTEDDPASLEDIRGYSLLLKYNAKGYQNYKFYGSTSFAKEYRNRIPMIKVSEMYLILAECYMKKGQTTECLNCINEISRHRGISDENLYGGGRPSGYFSLNDEFFKETLGEGQSIFFIKRRYAEDHDNIGNVTMINVDFLGKNMYLYPTEETSYGRVQEK